MFKKREAGEKPAKNEAGKQGEIVVMPGLNFQNLMAAWSFHKRTGRTHEPPDPRAKKAKR